MAPTVTSEAAAWPWCALPERSEKVVRLRAAELEATLPPEQAQLVTRWGHEVFLPALVLCDLLSQLGQAQDAAAVQAVLDTAEDWRARGAISAADVLALRLLVQH
jgi:hypothetical protein